MIEEMQHYYDRRAEIYDTSMGYDNPDTVTQLQPVIEHICREMSGEKVLELACGPCFWTQFTAAVAESIVACDFNNSTLSQARHKDLPWERVSLQQADAYDLKTLTGSFSAAMAVDWLAHVTYARMHPFLDGLHSVLNAGARVVFCDQLPKSEPADGDHDADGNFIVVRQLPDGSRYRVIKHYLSDHQIQDIFGRYDDNVQIIRFPNCRRIIVSYHIQNG